MPATGLPIDTAKLTRARLEAGLSMPALAIKADVSYSYLTRIERGTNEPSITILARLASALDRGPAEFLQDKQPALT